MHGEGREGIPLRAVWEMRKGPLQTEQTMVSSEGAWQHPRMWQDLALPYGSLDS